MATTPTTTQTTYFTQTQFWILAVVIVVVFGFIGFAINKWVMKPVGNTGAVMYSSIGAIVGIVIAAIVWYFTMKKEKEPVGPKKNVLAAMYNSPVALNQLGQNQSPVSAADYLSAMQGQ